MLIIRFTKVNIKEKIDSLSQKLLQGIMVSRCFTLSLGSRVWFLGMHENLCDRLPPSCFFFLLLYILLVPSCLKKIYILGLELKKTYILQSYVKKIDLVFIFLRANPQRNHLWQMTPKVIEFLLPSILSGPSLRVGYQELFSWRFLWFP